jgi:hypothetical protein
MGIALLTIVIVVVLVGAVLTFARLVVRRATRGTATQAANLFGYPEGRQSPDEENLDSPQERLLRAGSDQDTEQV